MHNFKRIKVTYIPLSVEKLEEDDKQFTALANKNGLVLTSSGMDLNTGERDMIFEMGDV